MHRFYFHNSSNNAFHHFANRNVALELQPKQNNQTNELSIFLLGSSCSLVISVVSFVASAVILFSLSSGDLKAAG